MYGTGSYRVEAECVHCCSLFCHSQSQPRASTWLVTTHAPPLRPVACTEPRGRTRPRPLSEAVEDAGVLGLVDAVLEEEPRHLEEGQRRHQAVGPRLVRGPDALDLKGLCDAVEAAFERLAALHDVLDVEEQREVVGEKREEVALLVRQLRVGQHLDEVAEVEVGVEGDPAHVLAQRQPRHHHEAAKLLHVDSVALVLLEVHPSLAEEVDGVLRENVALEVEGKVELPRAPLVQVPVLIGERQPQLDHPQQVHVALERLVLIVCVGPKSAVRTRHHTRKLGIHGNVRMRLHDI
mmetsp:Transcript_19148/g.38983  ORF Transcript_19148/g.38983 Transcript_19148/m.38983 type:complete len:293 (-) Transcript_19148:436-1314(-)